MASNSYGFDFLKSEHILESTDQEASHHDDTLNTSNSAMVLDDDAVMDASRKPDLEKQFDVLAFLQKHRGSGSALAPSLIYRSTGVDLETDTVVANMLQNNPKVRTEFIPDPENPALQVAHYAYRAKYPSVKDRTTLLAQINRMHTGIVTRDLADSYDSVEEDIRRLITAGDIIAIQNTEDKDRILFPRGESFYVDLDGLLALPSDSNEVTGVEMDVDPRKQIRRGEAVQVGGQWFRVSSCVRAGVSLAEQPTRAQAPLSVSSFTDLSQRNEQDGYIRPFSSKYLPLDDSMSQAAQKNVVAGRQARERLLKLAHGRSGGVTGQLTGSHAHASNPTTLATSFATGTSHLQRKRPHTKSHAPEHQPASKADLETAAADPSLALFSHARRHGSTRDVREMYLATRSKIPESDHELYQLLVEHKLLEIGEQMRRPRLAKTANVDNDGKPKKRRYYERKNQRMTNTHLEGTEIGAILARAAEKQKQGKSVGDGGM